MFSFKEKYASVKEGLVNSADVMKNKIEAIDINSITTSIKETADSATQTVSNVIKSEIDKTQELYGALSEKATYIDVDRLKDANFYKENIQSAYAKSSKFISDGFKKTFEIDKEINEVINDIKDNLPAHATDLSDIFEKCKKEALQRTVAAFCLGPLVYGLDNKLEARLENASVSYPEFNKKNNVRNHDNYKEMQKERNTAKENMMYLDDGYNSKNMLVPFDADIEHIVSAKEQYDNFFVRIATTNDELKDKINRKENLIFADSSLNSSKRDKDLIDYLDQKGKEDEFSIDVINIDIGEKTCTVNKNDAISAYEKAKKETKKDTVKAIATIGMSAVESGTKMATQQVVGLIIYETVDVFIDEINDVTCNFNINNLGNFNKNIADRLSSVHNKLKLRFVERDIFNRAKSLGIEAGVAGALSIIPQILISMLLQTPAFVLTIIRESTLSAVRCIRILSDKNVDKYEGIKIVMAGTAMAVIGAYASRLISTAISGVPLLKKFDQPVTSILSGIFITGIPLTAIYIFDQQKNNFVFSLRK